jgi:cell division cycle 2-like protein
MASQLKSKWADDPPEAAEAIAQRKQEKEEKRRLKEERLRQSAESQVKTQAAPTTSNGSAESGDVIERPTKRRRTSAQPDEAPKSIATSFELLDFPTSRFGPCRDVELYELLNNIEEGSYGMVSRARTKTTGEVVALKRLKMEYTNDGFPVTGLREIQTLMASKHPNIVNLREVVTCGGLNE